MIEVFKNTIIDFSNYIKKQAKTRVAIPYSCLFYTIKIDVPVHLCLLEVYRYNSCPIQRSD